MAAVVRAILLEESPIELMALIQDEDPFAFGPEASSWREPVRVFMMGRLLGGFTFNTPGTMDRITREIILPNLRPHFATAVIAFDLPPLLNLYLKNSDLVTLEAVDGFLNHPTEARLARIHRPINAYIDGIDPRPNADVIRRLSPRASSPLFAKTLQRIIARPPTRGVDRKALFIRKYLFPDTNGRHPRLFEHQPPLFLPLMNAMRGGLLDFLNTSSFTIRNRDSGARLTFADVTQGADIQILVNNNMWMEELAEVEGFTRGLEKTTYGPRNYLAADFTIFVLSRGRLWLYMSINVDNDPNPKNRCRVAELKFWERKYEFAPSKFGYFIMNALKHFCLMDPRIGRIILLADYSAAGKLTRQYTENYGFQSAGTLNNLNVLEFRTGLTRQGQCSESIDDVMAALSIGVDSPRLR